MCDQLPTWQQIKRIKRLRFWQFGWKTIFTNQQKKHTAMRLVRLPEDTESPQYLKLYCSQKWKLHNVWVKVHKEQSKPKIILMQKFSHILVWRQLRKSPLDDVTMSESRWKIRCCCQAGFRSAWSTSTLFWIMNSAHPAVCIVITWSWNEQILQ